jgi:hypothetical protein
MRIERLKARINSGALLGFRIQQDNLSGESENDINSLRKRIEKAAKLAATLTSLADRIERDGANAKRDILLSALRKDRTDFLDNAFLEGLGSVQDWGQA